MGAKKGNKNAVGNRGGGREPFYTDPAVIQKKINEYFSTNVVWTIPGLAYHLGFADKQSLINYEAKDEFYFPIKRAKLRIEDFNAQQLHRKDGGVTGIIFTLKNLGWVDKQEFSVTDQLTDEQIDQIIDKLKQNNNGK